ncbi:MAG TPA: DNA polymerase Y family protein [Aurantimonas sp.]|nr:DNA polymerase Y family protein [Aurantimonas sp.]
MPGSRRPRFLAVSLPKLSTDRIRRARMGRFWRSAAQADAALAPLALYEPVGNAYRVAAVCDRVEALGLMRGTGLAEAKARFPGLETLPAEPEADNRLLEAVADWCDRYTPLVALDPPAGLVLDISGCAHLFGGEKALMDDLLARLFHQGFRATAAIASHAGTALALVGHGDRPRVPAGGERAAVLALPIAALRLAPELEAMLQRLGLKTLEALLSLPRAGLARRFGAGLLDRLDTAVGLAERPIGPRRPVPALLAERVLFEPISLVEDVERILFGLAGRLKGDLERRGEGARRLELSLFRVDGAVNRLMVGAARPVREPSKILRLFRERMKGLGEDFDAGFGYDLVKLAVHGTEAMADIQTDLAGESGGEEAFAGLVDRLGARLGEAHVLRLRPGASHLPERACSWRPSTAETPAPWPDAAGAKAPGAPRPLRMLAAPEPVEASFEVPDGAPLKFRWRRALHVVRRAEGPERIAAEWWREAEAATRDYYRVEDEAGRRFWLFREGRADPAIDPELQVPDGRPAWFMHGLFA